MGCGFKLINILCVSMFGVVGCGKTESNSSPLSNKLCAPTTLSKVAADTGPALVFMPDPLAASGNLSLLPTSMQLDSYRKPVTLTHLSGEGVLKGTYITVLNSLQCDDGFGAYDPKNQFQYTHDDFRFQEAMAYYFGDIYQTSLDTMGYLASKKPVNIVAHCEMDDNAFFTRSNKSDVPGIELVCLGDSVKTPGASYADDAIVTIHELEHATTVDSYSLNQNMNQFWYDEAGALNEAISDFMGLIFTDAYLYPEFNLDPRVFSRWALGTFDRKASHVRGAHKCPSYDSNFPDCNQFPTFSPPHSLKAPTGTISYVYPDGLGWPYPGNSKEGYSVLDAYQRFPSQEEIHNAGILALGALWDVYDAIKKNHPNESESDFANRAMSQLVLESVKHLPSANSATNHSPVTLIGFASNLITYANQIKGINSKDLSLIQETLKARGLSNPATLPSEDWMDIGTGTNIFFSNTPTPGIHVVDDPEVLQKWLMNMGGNPDIVTQNLDSEINSRLDPGEVAVIWFDIQNNLETTAGGVLVSVTSKDPDLRVLDGLTNIGYMTLSGLNQTQVMYGKINGTAIVSVLSPVEGGGVPVGNSYFKTNPFFNQNWRTGIWVKVSPNAAHGKKTELEVRATPANGITAVRNFPITIY